MSGSLVVTVDTGTDSVLVWLCTVSAVAAVCFCETSSERNDARYSSVELMIKLTMIIKMIHISMTNVLFSELDMRPGLHHIRVLCSNPNYLIKSNSLISKLNDIKSDKVLLSVKPSVVSQLSAETCSTWSRLSISDGLLLNGVSKCSKDRIMSNM